MGLLDYLFQDYDIECKRDVPEDIRQSVHRMLDKILDTEDGTDFYSRRIELSRKLDGIRELYPIRKYRKER